MAVSKYDREYLTPEGQKRIAELTGQAERGELGWDAAHRAAEELRDAAGYSGGRYGDRLLTRETPASHTASQGASQSASQNARSKAGGGDAYTRYTSQYADRINDLTEKLLSGSYSEWKQGGEYAALADAYAKNGQRAMQDTLGQVSARTGGLASSYAGTAAQQSYNGYMDALEQAALEMYGADRDRTASSLSLLAGLDDRDYSRWADQRSFDYGAGRDAVADRRYDTEWNYGVGRDQVGDQRYDQAYADSRDDTEYGRRRQDAETLAAYGDFSGYKALGYSDEALQNMKAAYDAAKLLSARGSGSGSGDGKQVGAEDYDGLFQAASQALSPKNYIANHYREYGFASSSGLYDAYGGWETEKKRPVANGRAMNPDHYRAFGQSIEAQLAAGQENAAIGNIDSRWAELSEDQRAGIRQLLAAFGYEYQPD